jgi:predicted nucleotidyltransferase
MLTESELRILSAFFPEGTERTTKEIEKRSGYSHERTYSTLNALEEKRILSKKKVGKALVFSIKNFEDSVYLAFIYYSLNKKTVFTKKYPSVWKIMEEFMNKTNLTLVVLFGSYSRDEAKERSDIDILCINGLSDVEKIALSLRHKYNLKLVPIIINKEDFNNIKSENPPLWKELLTFGIIMRGYELFYDLVYK